jgi:hypothetical protein
VDDEGLDLEGPWEARVRAIAALPDIAEEVLPDGDRRTLAVTVRDEAGVAVFRATLTLRGEWLACR